MNCSFCVLLIYMTNGFLFAVKEQIYEKCVQQLVISCMDGYNATVFAYGQTVRLFNPICDEVFFYYFVQQMLHKIYVIIV